jgi:hypothetical protein
MEGGCEEIILCLKGQCHEICCFWFFSRISFPPSPEYPIRTVSNFFRKFVEIFASQGAPPYQRHCWQILPPIPLVLLIHTGINDTGDKFATGVNDTGGKQRDQLSDCSQLKMNLKKKIYLYANSTTQRCPKEIIKKFLIKDFFHLPPVSTTGGKLINEKNQKQKIS